MTNKEIIRIAMNQSAIDSSCAAEDFQSDVNKVVLSCCNPHARKYLKLPFYCNLTSYGSSIVASVHPDFADTVREYINRYPAEHCFETPNMHVLDDELNKRTMSVCFMAEYFLPDADLLRPLECDYDIRILQPKDFADCYLPQWSNALTEKCRHLDMLAAGAFENGRLVGLAGCSADCDTMWQIGIDVLPAYRRKGIAAAITSRLTVEIIKKDIVPFYCAAWSNIRSVRNAIKCGFKPAWIELTAKSIDFVEALNK